MSQPTHIWLVAFFALLISSTQLSVSDSLWILLPLWFCCLVTALALFAHMLTSKGSIASKAAKLLQYACLAVLHLCSSRRLTRTPEPSAVTNDEEDVDDYDRVMSTVMVLPYAITLNYIAQARNHTGADCKALDICCGPGLFTLLLQQKLDYSEVLGIDLSEGMVKKACANAVATGCETTRFQVGSAFGLPHLPSQSFDLITFCNGAHQFDTIEQVQMALAEAQRLVKADGLIVVLDPVRQKTAQLTEGYVQVAGQDYLDRGMPSFYRQFQESMYAAWTPEELASALPADTSRRWFQALPNGLPTFQILLGIPAAQTQALQHPAPTTTGTLVPRDLSFDWTLLSGTFATGSFKEIRG